MWGVVARFFAAIWAKIGVYVAIAGAVALAIVGALWKGERRGRQVQAHADAAKAARQEVAQAQVAGEVYKDASEAAAKAKESVPTTPPDAVKRDDLDTTF